MSETPSQRRRKGREAFDPGTDPMMVQPYKQGAWSYKYYLQDWLDGWEEERISYEKQLVEFEAALKAAKEE